MSREVLSLTFIFQPPALSHRYMQSRMALQSGLRLSGTKESPEHPFFWVAAAPLQASSFKVMDAVIE
jgi:hypothetical protein